jgi:large subunit ribosomal protein L4
MELSIRSDAGGVAASLSVAEEVFGAEFKPGLIHQVVTAYLAASRSGTKAQKTRAMVSGGNSKPFRQKGTGSAMPGAVRSIVSELARQGRLVVVPELSLGAPKTKDLVSKLAALGLTDVLILTDDLTENLYYAARNLPGVDVMTAREVDPASLVAFEHVLATEAAVRKLEERLA